MTADGQHRWRQDSSQRGQVITHEQAVALPLNGREYSALALLTTGVRLSALNTGSASTVREGSFNVNGLRSTFNNFLLDGLDNNAYGTSNQGFSNQVMQPPPDAVAEFKVVTNNMSAEYGRAAGPPSTWPTQSGTNRFRGAAWEFLRDTSLNATGFFKPVSGEKPPLRAQPVRRRAGRPDRARTRRSSSSTTRASGRRAAGRLLDDPDARAAARDPHASRCANPLTGAGLRRGHADPDDAVRGRRCCARSPTRPHGSAANNYQILQTFKNHNDKYDAKVDVQVNPSLRAFARFGYRDVDIFDQPPIPLPSGGAATASPTSPTSSSPPASPGRPATDQLLEFRFGWSRTEAGKNPPALGTPSAQEAYGITGPARPTRGSPAGCPTQLIAGYSDLGRQATNPQWQYPTVFNPKVNYTRSMGRHSLKAGLEFQHVRTEVQDVNPLYGRDEYAGRFSRPVGSTSTDNQYNLADFMFGLRSRYALTNFFIANLRQNLYFALRAGRLPGERQADPEPGPALRIRDRPSGRRTTSSPTSTRTGSR